MDVGEYNRAQWNRRAEAGNEWSIPVTPEQIAAARKGEWEVLLTPTKFVPRSWFGEIAGSLLHATACPTVILTCRTMIAMFEDGWDEVDVMSKLFPPFIATRSVKPA